jgi:hypothetical protein
MSLNVVNITLRRDLTDIAPPDAIILSFREG